MASVDTSLLPHPFTRNHVRPCWTGPTFTWSAEAQWRQGPAIAAHLHHKVGPERTEKLHQRPHQERVGFRLSHLSLFVTLVHLSHLPHLSHLSHSPHLSHTRHFTVYKHPAPQLVSHNDPRCSPPIILQSERARERRDTARSEMAASVQPAADRGRRTTRWGVAS